MTEASSTNGPRPPGRKRRLGRPFRGTADNLPARLRRWHAPRANRWERIDVVAGEPVLEWLGIADIATQRMAAGDGRWIAPGTRWRIARMDGDACFELATFADETTTADAPQAVRLAWLDRLPVVRLEAGSDPVAAMDALHPGEARLLRAAFDCSAQLAAAIEASGGTCSWHPLDAGPGLCTAVIVRPAEPADLANYMGRDHAIIESALAGALAGDAERARWLHHALARHLAIEEQLLFPAYLDAGGNEDWIRALRREHDDLRRHLPHLGHPVSRRRFLLMLDGHDEKEEQLIYPDIVARTTSSAAGLVARAASFALAA